MSEASDFDFWPGQWKVHNRRLRKRLAGSDEWEEFQATSVARHILGGCGNEDEFHTDWGGGFVNVGAAPCAAASDTSRASEATTKAPKTREKRTIA